MPVSSSAVLSNEYQALLKAVADELKLPLMRIARQAELAQLTNFSAERTLELVRQSADSALGLVDGYLLGLELAETQQALQLEPVSATSVIYEVAERLEALARERSVDLTVELPGQLVPVMANRAGLEAALLSLGTAVLEAQVPAKQPARVTIAAYRCRGSIAAGLYTNGTSVTAAELQSIRQAGKRRQPLRRFSAGGAAGIFVAQNILEAMAARLRTAHYHKQAGLAAIFQPSRQLELV